jgi:hypothetical protein
MNYSADIRKTERNYLPSRLYCFKLGGLEPFFKELLSREISVIERSRKMAERFQ